MSRFTQLQKVSDDPVLISLNFRLLDNIGADFSSLMADETLEAKRQK